MTITLRQETDAGATTKGAALTYAELDNNFIDLIAKINDVVDDTTPQLGGDLDVNGNSIVSASNGDIAITPNGTGSVVLDGLNWPQADGTADYVLKTNGAGQLSWVAQSAGLSNLVEDTTPQLGGDLDVNGNSIVTTSAGNIEIAPDTTGQVNVTSNQFKVAYNGNTLFSTATNAVQLYYSTDPSAKLSTTATGVNISGDLYISDGIDVAGNEVKDLQLEDYKETVYTGGSTTGTITPDVANGNVQKISLTGNITFNAFANAEAGQSMTLIIDTNGTGRTLTSTMLFAGGTSTLSTTDTVDIMSVFYDGTTYYASLSTNFS